MAFHKLVNLIDLYDGCHLTASVGRLRLVVTQVEGRVCIFEDRCPHMDAPLSTGKVIENQIVCRAHGIAFSLTSGRADGPLADTMDCLQFFPVVYEGNAIGIEL